MQQSIIKLSFFATITNDVIANTYSSVNNMNNLWLLML